ncbi:MAG TPA: hypothetical protein VJ881_04515 [Halanaerobiales bacterium]|nr:hypothetical protein [Halanaerobiales bacterium]
MLLESFSHRKELRRELHDNKKLEENILNLFVSKQLREYIIRIAMMNTDIYLMNI